MPKTIPTPGTEWSPALALAALNPKFNDGNNDGDNPRLDDDALSNTPGQIKDQWRSFRDALSVVGTGGLNIAIVAGTVLGGDSQPITVAASVRSVASSQTNFAWVDSAGIVQVGTALPVQCMPLARIIAGASSILSIADLRPRQYILPQMRAVPVFGGNSALDTLYSGNYSEGRIDCRNFTLNAGVTLSIPNGSLWIEASGDVTINGTINITPPILGGSGFAGGAGIQYYAAESGRGLGGGGGHNGVAAPAYSHFASLFGSSGASGFGSVSSAAGGSISQSRGGAGGGFLVIRAAGRITINGNINCNGGAGIAGTASGTTGVIVLTGGGGGSGGLVLLQSLTGIVAPSPAQISVRGGNGGGGFSINYASNLTQGGGGGGGGRIICESPSVNLTGLTALVTGGNPGLDFGSGAGVGGSVGGSFGGVGGSGGLSGGTGILSTRLITPS